MKGLVAWDDAVSGRRPGVLVVHEWWGHNDYARKRARMLAEAGYVALAVDMFGDGKTAAHPEDAGKFAAEAMADLDAARQRFEAARAVLAARPETDPGKIAAIGYCFGGGVVLQMARLGMDLKAVASFHGSLGARVPAARGAVRAKILVCHGAEDAFVRPEAVQAFREEMDAAGADYRVLVHPGAAHGFSNPDATAKGEEFGLPIAYRKEADEASWQALRELLAAAFAAG
jgi:dienelactone hydrolase